MTPWIQLSSQDLRAYLVADQLSALQTEALGAGQADPFLEVAPAVIAKVRGFIASNASNVLDAQAGSIPPELKLDVCYLIIAPMLGRLGIALTADQVRAVEAANSTLLRLADGKLSVSKPAVPTNADVQARAGIELASSTRRRFTQDSLRSL
jgi:hypothetical protein